MKLQPAQIEMLRHCLIAQIAAAGMQGLPLATIHHGARLAGFGRLEPDDLLPHLDYLTLDGKLSVAGAAVAAALKRWAITGAGARYAEENGLA